jgi:hypothetical protein
MINVTSWHRDARSGIAKPVILARLATFELDDTRAKDRGGERQRAEGR